MRGSCRGYNFTKEFESEYDRLGIDYKNKISLNMCVDVWAPKGLMTSTDVVLYHDNEVLHKIEEHHTHRPYPNKDVVNTAIRFGRKSTKRFIPLFFDNLNELRKINKIVIIHRVWYPESSVNEYCVVSYNVKFADKVQSGYYAFRSYDFPFGIYVGIKSDTKDDTVCEERIKWAEQEIEQYDRTCLVRVNMDMMKYCVLRSTSDIMSIDDIMSDILHVLVKETLMAQNDFIIDFYQQDIEITDDSYVP